MFKEKFKNHLKSSSNNVLTRSWCKCALLPLFNAVCQLFADPVVLWKFPEDFGDQVGTT